MQSMNPMQFSQYQIPLEPKEIERGIEEVELEQKLKELQTIAAKKDKKLAKRQNAIENWNQDISNLEKEIEAIHAQIKEAQAE